MTFKRVWDSTCPKVYDQWEADGTTWIIQDLPPEDDEEALKLLQEHMYPDEVLCNLCGLANDPASVAGIMKFWRKYLQKRMSLACYAVVNGQRDLAGLNVCGVSSVFDDTDDEIEGECWKNVYNVLLYLEQKADSYKYMGIDRQLYAVGLVVKTKYRGFKLGARILAARKPLSLQFGIKGTATVFTGEASQKLAMMCGFETIATAYISELSAICSEYPKNDNRPVKLMVKKFE